MFANRPIALLYLDKTGLIFFGGNVHDIVSLDITSVSAQLEIYSREQLENLIKGFIETNKIMPANLYMVLSENALFLKGFPAETQNVEESIQKFVDNIPFESVSSRTYDVDSGKLVLATNKDFYKPIELAFEKNGFSTLSVTPIFFAGVTLDPNVGFDKAAAEKILANTQSLRQNSLETVTEKEVPIKAEAQVPQKKTPDKKRVYVLGGVFGVLILILVLMLVMNSQPTPPKAAVITPVQNVATPTSLPTLSPSISQAASSPRIKIITSSADTNLAVVLKEDLSKIGFSTTNTEVTTNSIPTKTIIIFSNTVSQINREKIIAAVSVKYPNPISTESQLSDSEVSITLVK